MPSPTGYGNSIATSPVDLSGLPELYIHSSLSYYNTLTSGGMRDVIAVVTIDQDWGSRDISPNWPGRPRGGPLAGQ